MGHPSEVLAVICPGQGAQSPGMLSPWLDLEPFAQAIAEFSEVVSLDLARLGTEADADAIRDTAIAQPLLVSTALAAARVLGVGGPGNARARVEPGVVAGHSVGEFGAVVLAGVLTDHDSLKLVSVRAKAMAAAAAASEPTSMAAVLGGEPADVAEALASLGLTPANMNGGGQVVAAGSREAIAALVAAPPAAARVIELQVAGAFHTSYMAPAVEALAAAAVDVERHDPVVTLLSNADGTAVLSGDDAIDRMVRQVAHPVRWDLCQEAMLNLGVTAIIELSPGGVLAGLAKRTMKGIPTVALKTPADLDAARDLMEQHA